METDTEIAFDSKTISNYYLSSKKGKEKKSKESKVIKCKAKIFKIIFYIIIIITIISIIKQINLFQIKKGIELTDIILNLETLIIIKSN